MGVSGEEHLQPSGLCDFDRCSAICDKARELTRDCANDGERFRRIFEFVKELPYGLEDWDAFTFGG